MCPDFPRVKAEVDPATVWTYPNRTLTSLAGQPRADLIGADQSLADVGYTGARAAKLDNLDRLPSIEAFDAPIEGTVTMDGTEVTVVQDEITGNPTRHLEGWIDLSPMQAGDVVVIRVYTKIKPDGEWKLYDEGRFYGKQAYPALHILPRVTGYAYKVTLQQVSGVYKSFDYLFVKTA